MFKNNILIFVILLLFNTQFAYAQIKEDNIPTKGTEFWLGFMNNFVRLPTEELSIFVSSSKSTKGTISIPGKNYKQNFSVVANVTTKVVIPNDIAEVFTDDIIDNKGVFITTVDTVSIFAINYKDHTADASKILPIQSLGTSYSVVSYESWQASTMFLPSELLIVATEDNTEINITPSCNTLGGHAKGVTYTIKLNKGEVYQVKGAAAGDDLTGTFINGTEKSGGCRPFAVFSGHYCANIPVDCPACDHIFDQNFPTQTWGSEYFSIPYQNTSSYLLKIIAKENNTVVKVDGVAHILNAGQKLEFPLASSGMHIIGNKPISVTQFAKGTTCVGSGDPAMLILNSEEEKISDITFSTVASQIIKEHNINIVTKTSEISKITLNGSALNPANFKQYPSNPKYSFATISVPEGSHHLKSPAGFTAYVYGTGDAESYTYSVGSFSPGKEIPLDSVLCTTSEITIGTNKALFSPWWSKLEAPEDTIAFGNFYKIKPTKPEVYILKGNSKLSGCEEEYAFSVDLPNPPTLNINASNDTISTCQLQPVSLDVSITPIGSYKLTWSPANEVEILPNGKAIIRPIKSGWYKVKASSIGGCSFAEDSIFISVVNGNIASLKVLDPNPKICQGDTVKLESEIEQFVLNDDFSSGISPSVWSKTLNATVSSNCGTDKALYFNGVGNRLAETKSINTFKGGTIYFSIKIGNGVFPCDDVDFGEDIVLEYSINNGTNWGIIQTMFEFDYENETNLKIKIPDVAKSNATIFRWRQLSNSGLNQDNWTIDNVSISTISDQGLSIIWSPNSFLKSKNDFDPLAFPKNTTKYKLDVTSFGCTYTDSVLVSVGKPFKIKMTNDTILCSVAGIRINVNADGGNNNTIKWKPALFLNDSTLFNPIANPSKTISYQAIVTSEEFCKDSAKIKITVANPVDLRVKATDSLLCKGDTALLKATIVGSGMKDNFDKAIDFSQWAIVSGISSTDCGSVNANALYFAGSSREARTIPINTIGGGNISFSIKFGSSSGACEDADAGEDVALEYSTDGITWNNIAIYDESDYTVFKNIVVPIPAAAISNKTQFRWRQVSFSGSGSDIWVLDEVSISAAIKPTNYTFDWTPKLNLKTPNLDSTFANPIVSTNYFVKVTDKTTGCVLGDSVRIKVGDKFPIKVTNDTVLCSVKGIPLQVTHGAGTGALFSWNTSKNISDSTSANPIARPIQTTTYSVSVISKSGCKIIDSVKISVANPVDLRVKATDSLLCKGDTALLKATIVGSGMKDNFDKAIDFSQWAIVSGISSTDCGSVNANALYFAGSSREARTIPINTIGGGNISFSIKFGSSSGACEDADAGEDVALEYSTDGITWNNIAIYDESDYTVFKNIVVPIPAAAISNKTQFRWRQVSFSGSGSDIWVLDEVSISAAIKPTNYTFDWTPKLNLKTPNLDSTFANPIVSTNYFVKVTDKTTGCVLGDSVRILINGSEKPLPNDTTLCSTKNFQIITKPLPIGSKINWTPSDLLNNSKSFNPILLKDTTANYIATIFNGNCTYTDTIKITQNVLSNYDIIKDSTICPSDSIKLWIKNVPKVVWSSTSKIDNPFNLVTSVKLDSSATFYAKVDLGGNCSILDSVKISIFTNATNTQIDSTICEGDSIKMDFSGYQTSIWDDGSTENIRFLKQPKRYIITSINPCNTSIDTINVITNPKPIISLGNDTLICQDEFVFYDVSKPNHSYLWSDKTTNGFNTIIKTDTVAVKITNSFHCSSSDTVIVIVNPKPTITWITNPILCKGDSLLLKVDSLEYQTQLWSTGEIHPTINITDTGYYAITIQNLQGCKQKDSVHVVFGIEPDLKPLTDSIICEGNTIILNPGLSNPKMSYKWNTLATKSSIAASDSGLYILSVISTDLCSITDSMRIRFSKPNPIIADHSPITCSGNDVQLSVSGGKTYSWSPSTGLDNPNISNPKAKVIKPTTYYVTLLDSIGCQNIDSVFISPIFTSLNFTNDTNICLHDTLVLKVPNNATSFNWSTGETTPEIKISKVGTYWLETTSACGTQRDSIKIISLFPLPTLDFTKDTIICESPINISALTNASTIKWSTGETTLTIETKTPKYYTAEVSDINNCKSIDSVQIYKDNLPEFVPNDISICPYDSILINYKTNSLVNWSTGETNDSLYLKNKNNYKVTLTGKYGCIRTDVFTLNHFDLPNLALPIDTFMCKGEEVILDGGNEFTSYSWSNGKNTAKIDVKEKGIYRLIAKTKNGCLDTAQTQVSIAETPKILLEDSYFFCDNDPKVIDATIKNIKNYIWSSGENSAKVQFSNPGSYFLTVIDSNNCKSTKTINVVFDESPKQKGIIYDTICFGESLELNAFQTNALQYTWSNSEKKPVITITQLGNYTVEISNNCGLIVQEFNIYEKICSVFVPNGFSPNGDGQNDYWVIEGIEDFPEATLIIYNRWGEIVYETNEPQIPWEGIRNGKQLPIGTYYFVLNLGPNHENIAGGIGLMR